MSRLVLAAKFFARFVDNMPGMSPKSSPHKPGVQQVVGFGLPPELARKVKVESGRRNLSLGNLYVESCETSTTSEIDPLAALLLGANAAVLGFAVRLQMQVEDYRAISLPRSMAYPVHREPALRRETAMFTKASGKSAWSAAREARNPSAPEWRRRQNEPPATRLQTQNSAGPRPKFKTHETLPIDSSTAADAVRGAAQRAATPRTA